MERLQNLSNDVCRSRIDYFTAAVVFIIAIVARLPSCYESFWLDELHSAWSIWGSLEDVAPRAAAGNQTPTFFWGLWLWKACFGESEVMLRLPVVVASAAAAAVTTYGLYRVTSSLAGACAGGLTLALESNALFYGTELRPFALIIMLGTIACWIASKPIKPGRDRETSALAVLVIAAAFFQPTSLGVFIWLFILRYAAWRYSALKCEVARFRDRQISRPETAGPSWSWRTGLIALLLSLFVLLSGHVLSDAWQHRSQWNQMGRATSLLQIWQAWPWGPLVLIPMLLVVVTKVVPGKRVAAGGTVGDGWLVPLAALLAVCTFWIASAVGIAPVFHRRYFVACLPMLGWSCGHGIAIAIQELRRFAIPAAWRIVISLTLAATPVVTLLATQGTLQRLLTGDTRLARRGEGWREATNFLKNQQPQVASLSVSAGLIESSRLLSDRQATVATYAQWYLTYPLSGPYALTGVKAVDLSGDATIIELPLVLRGSRTMAQQWISARTSTEAPSPVIHSFGGIQVILPR